MSWSVIRVTQTEGFVAVRGSNAKSATLKLSYHREQVSRLLTIEYYTSNAKLLDLNKPNNTITWFKSDLSTHLWLDDYVSIVKNCWLIMKWTLESKIFIFLYYIFNHNLGESLLVVLFLLFNHWNATLLFIDRQQFNLSSADFSTHDGSKQFCISYWYNVNFTTYLQLVLPSLRRHSGHVNIEIFVISWYLLAFFLSQTNSYRYKRELQ